MLVLVTVLVQVEELVFVAVLLVELRDDVVAADTVDVLEVCVLVALALLAVLVLVLELLVELRVWVLLVDVVVLELLVELRV